MEYMLIHRPRGPLPPEISKIAIESLKQLLAKPEEFVPGGKIIAAYDGRLEEVVFCVWDVPNAENLMSFFEQGKNIGWDTQIIPVDKIEVAISKWEKALAEAEKIMKK